MSSFPSPVQRRSRNCGGGDGCTAAPLISGGRFKKARWAQPGIGDKPHSHSGPSRATQHSEGRPVKVPTSIDPSTPIVPLKLYVSHHKLVDLHGKAVTGRSTHLVYKACVEAAKRQIPGFVPFDEDDFRRPRSPVEFRPEEASNPPSAAMHCFHSSHSRFHATGWAPVTRFSDPAIPPCRTPPTSECTMGCSLTLFIAPRCPKTGQAGSVHPRSTDGGHGGSDRLLTLCAPWLCTSPCPVFSAPA